jgi:two-component system sensor histidine kinase FlrB
MALAIDRTELHAAFETFTEVSTALEASYRGLEREVQRLYGELARARTERARHDAERELLAQRQAELLDLLARQKRLSTLGEMAARLAHDVRTPLAAALLYASRLGGEQPVDEAARRELAAKLVARLKHLDGLVGDMLAFARGAGPMLVRCDVGALLESVAQSLVARLDARARLTIRTHAPGLAVRGNPEALVGAILNLANNAFDAAGPTAHVEIEAALVAQRAEIRVRDNGPGIPPELAERVFEPFFTTKSGGTGLGLAAVRVVAQAHGGAIELEHAGPGACFCLRLAADGDAA